MLAGFRRATVGGALSLMVALASTVALSGPSEAVGDPAATVSTGNGVLYSGCRQHSFSYAVTLPAGSTHWDLDVTAYGPDGLEVSGDYLYGSTDSPPPGTGSVQICGGGLAGRYTLSTLFEWSDQDYNDHSTTLAPVPFTMRKPYTRTTLAASSANPRYGQRVTFKVTSKDERPTGYFANTYAGVRLQRYSSGGWSTVKGGRLTTNEYGRASMRYRFAAHHRQKFRAVTVGTTDYAQSTSATVILR